MFLTSEEHDERKCRIASEELKKVSCRLSASVDLNNQNKKNRKKKAVEANTKLLDVLLTDEDFEVFELLYANNENNLFGLLEYLRRNCSLKGPFNDFNDNLSTYIINTIPPRKCFVWYLRTRWFVSEISTR